MWQTPHVCLRIEFEGDKAFLSRPRPRRLLLTAAFLRRSAELAATQRSSAQTVDAIASDPVHPNRLWNPAAGVGRRSNHRALTPALRRDGGPGYLAVPGTLGRVLALGGAACPPPGGEPAFPASLPVRRRRYSRAWVRPANRGCLMQRTRSASRRAARRYRMNETTRPVGRFIRRGPGRTGAS